MWGVAVEDSGLRVNVAIQYSKNGLKRLLYNFFAAQVYTISVALKTLGPLWL